MPSDDVDDEHAADASPGQAVKSADRAAPEAVPMWKAMGLPTASTVPCGSVLAYQGCEFGLERVRAATRHACEREGCWHFLGKGHTLEPLQLAGDEKTLLCTNCGNTPYFTLRAGGGFGWASKEDSELMRAGMSMARPAGGFGLGFGEMPA